MIISFLFYLYQNNETAKKAGHILLKLAFVAQLVAIAFYISGVKSTTDAPAQLKAQLAANPSQYIVAGRAIAEKEGYVGTAICRFNARAIGRSRKNIISNSAAMTVSRI